MSLPGAATVQSLCCVFRLRPAGRLLGIGSALQDLLKWSQQEPLQTQTLPSASKPPCVCCLLCAPLPSLICPIDLSTYAMQDRCRIQEVK